MEQLKISRVDNLKIKNIKNSLLPDTDAESFNLLVNKARVFFDVTTPNDNQIVAVSIYGKDSKQLKGFL